MNYIALYRKYRPQNFDEIKGQNYIVQTLKNILDTNQLTHAYLFAGPRGTGKTSFAKIFAAAINCIHSESRSNICEMCLKKNNSLDIIEMDAASNNSVNDIRDMINRAEFSPTNSNYKIYIIDEVHMLSTGAFNALLKTLEEPPQHVIFILATTDPDKIPATILSRVQRYNFQHISNIDLQDRLSEIFSKENIKYEEGTLEVISSLAKGSLRDALSISDQLSSYTSKNINKKSINEIFGLVDIENIIKFINFISARDISGSIVLFNKLVDDGMDILKFINEIIKLLRDYLIYKKSENSENLRIQNSQVLDAINLNSNIIYEMIEILIPLTYQIKKSDIPQELFQLSIVKLISLNGELQDISIISESQKENEKLKTSVPIDVQSDIDILSDFDDNTLKNNLSLESIESVEIIKEDEVIYYDENDEFLNNETKTQELDSIYIEDKIESNASDTSTFKEDEEISENIVNEEMIEILDDDAFDEEISFDFNEEKLTRNYRLSSAEVINLFLLSIKDSYSDMKYSLEQSAKIQGSFKNLNILVSESRFVCSGNDFILISSDYDDAIEEIINLSGTKEYRTFVDKAFGENIVLFAIKKNEFKEAKKEFSTKKENNEIMKPHSIENIKEIRENELDIKSENSSAEKFGESFFGDVYNKNKK